MTSSIIVFFLVGILVGMIVRSMVANCAEEKKRQNDQRLAWEHRITDRLDYLEASTVSKIQFNTHRSFTDISLDNLHARLLKLEKAVFPPPATTPDTQKGTDE